MDGGWEGGCRECGRLPFLVGWQGVAFDLVEPYGNLWGIMGARASPEGTPKLPGNRKQPISNPPETKRQNSLGAKKKAVPAYRHSLYALSR